MTLLGILLAFIAALAGATHNLFIRFATEHGSTRDAIYVVMTISTLILVPIVLVLEYPSYGLTWISWIAFLAAGLIGMLLGMIGLYAGIKTIGASRTTPIVAANALVATILAILFLGETLTRIHATGIVLIVGGIAVIGWETSHENPDNLSRRSVLLSLVFPFGAALAFGLEPIFANIGFAEGTPATVGLAIKTAAAWAGYVLYLRFRGELTRLSTIQSTDLRWYMLAGIANTVFLLTYYLGLEIAPVNVVVPILITNTLFVVILSAMFMPQRLEQVTWKLIISALVVVIGAIIITLFA